MGKFADALSERVLLFDGGMGALLGQMGYITACPDEYAVTKPDVIRRVHDMYLEAGADVITADSFGATDIALSHKNRAGKGCEYTRAAVTIARQAAGGRALVAVDIGPTSEFMAPVGARGFEEFYQTFLAQARCAKDAGADFALIETQTDAAECRAACLACLDAGLEAAASFTYSSRGRTLTGGAAACCAIMLTASGACALGVNCMADPKDMLPILRDYMNFSPLPAFAQPNAGLPAIDASGSAVFPYTPRMLAEALRGVEGVSGIGGCCGTTPEHIRLLKPLTGGAPPRGAREYEQRVCSARAHMPLDQAARGVIEIADIDDLYDIEDETALALIDITGLSPEAASAQIAAAQAATHAPLAFRADDADALEAALRAYAGVAAVCAPSGFEAILRRYGAHRL